MAKKSYILILLAASLWGMMGVFLHIVTADGVTSVEAAAIRLSLAAFFTALYLLITDRSAFRIRLRDLWIFLCSGLFSVMLYTICYFEAIQLCSMSVAAVLSYTSPIFVMLMSAVLFKEKLTGRKFVALGMTLTGCILVTGVLGDGLRVTGKGVFLGVCAGFMWATYSIFGKFALKRYKPTTLTLYTFIFAAVGVVPVSGILGNLAILASPKVIAGGLGLAVVSCLLPYTLYTTGLKNVEASKASVMATLEPVVASIWGIALFHENANVLKLLGIALVVGAIVLLNVQSRKKKS